MYSCRIYPRLDEVLFIIFLDILTWHRSMCVDENQLDCMFIFDFVGEVGVFFSLNINQTKSKSHFNNIRSTSNLLLTILSKNSSILFRTLIMVDRCIIHVYSFLPSKFESGHRIQRMRNDHFRSHHQRWTYSCKSGIVILDSSYSYFYRSNLSNSFGCKCMQAWMIE